LGAELVAGLMTGFVTGLGVGLASDFGGDFAAVLAGTAKAGFLTEALGMAILLVAPACRRINLRCSQDECPDTASLPHQLSTARNPKSRN
jgi:hypothetical protein